MQFVAPYIVPYVVRLTLVRYVWISRNKARRKCQSLESAYVSLEICMEVAKYVRPTK